MSEYWHFSNNTIQYNNKNKNTDSKILSFIIHVNEGGLVSSLRSGVLLTIPQHAGTWIQDSTQVPKPRDAHTLIKHNVKSLLQTLLALTDCTLQQLLSWGRGGRMDTWIALPVSHHPQGTIWWRTYFSKLIQGKKGHTRVTTASRKIKSSIVTPCLNSSKRCIHNTVLVTTTILPVISAPGEFIKD